ncbi:TPA: hypothetical protein ACOBUB_002154 [Enterococcus faecium]
MIIKTIALGNSKEAYVEKLLTENFNVISSDDNNKGKTIVIQSLAFCLGNTPVFPTSFDYKKYYYIVEFEHDDQSYLICRRKDNFIIKSKKAVMIFDNVSEMKRYWSKNIFKIPQILKNDVLRLADPELFIQLFFVGQDKKDTSNIANKGFYNKKDFYNMLYSYNGLGFTGMTLEEIDSAKRKIRSLKEEKKVLLKKHKILNSKNTSVNYLSQHSDRVAFEEKVKQAEKLRIKIGKLRTGRNTSINRKAKYEITLKELRSLNRTIPTGELHCLDCDSKNIGYTTSDSMYTFDVSTVDVRNQIIESIEEKISSYTEEIERQTIELNQCQNYFQEILADDSVSLESIVLYKQEIVDASGVEDKLKTIEKEIMELNDSLKASEETNKKTIEEQNRFMDTIVKEMNIIYRKIDNTGTLKFDDIFTKNSENFSGSEATEFHLAKVYAFAKIMKHPYPIIVDSFRAEDLSTGREKIVIDLFSQLENQIIFTTTLKREEIGKYNNSKVLNHIDYSSHSPSKILNKDFVSDFSEIMNQLMINFNN